MLNQNTHSPSFRSVSDRQPSLLPLTLTDDPGRGVTRLWPLTFDGWSRAGCHASQEKLTSHLAVTTDRSGSGGQRRPDLGPSPFLFQLNHLKVICFVFCCYNQPKTVHNCVHTPVPKTRAEDMQKEDLTTKISTYLTIRCSIYNIVVRRYKWSVKAKKMATLHPKGHVCDGFASELTRNEPEKHDIYWYPSVFTHALGTVYLHYLPISVEPFGLFGLVMVSQVRLSPARDE